MNRPPNIVLPGDEDLARSSRILTIASPYIRRRYKKINSKHWLMPCIVCSCLTQRLAKFEQNNDKRNVAYVCNSCIHLRRFERIRRAPRQQPRRRRWSLF